MNLFDIINEAYEKKLGDTTSKLTKQDMKLIENTSVKWIKELSDSDKKKYALLLIRLVDRKRGANVQELRYKGYRIPSIPQAKVIKNGILNKKEPEKILLEILNNSSYKRYVSKDRKTLQTVNKVLKTGLKKEKPLIGKLSKKLNRPLTDREKELAVYLNEKPNYAYKWNITDLSLLFSNDKFQNELINFNPWKVSIFGDLIIKKEVNFFKNEDEYEKLKKERTKRNLTKSEIEKLVELKKFSKENPNPLKEFKNNKTALYNLSIKLKESDLNELQKYLTKHPNFIIKKNDSENINDYLNKVFKNLKKYFNSEAGKLKNKGRNADKKLSELTSLLYIIDDFIQKLNKTPFPVEKGIKNTVPEYPQEILDAFKRIGKNPPVSVKSVKIPDDYYNIKNVNDFILVLKDLIKLNHNDKMFFDVFKNKEDSALKITDSTSFKKENIILKKINKLNKEKNQEFDTMIAELKKNSGNIEIPPYKGNIDIRRYLRGILMSVSTKAGFLSRITRRAMIALISEIGETFLPDNESAPNPGILSNIEDVVKYIIKNKKFED